MIKVIKENQKIAEIDWKQVQVSIKCNDKKVFFDSKSFLKFLVFAKSFPNAIIKVNKNCLIANENNENICLILTGSFNDSSVLVEF